MKILRNILKSIIISAITIALLFTVLTQIPYTVNTYKFTKNNQEIIFQEMVHFGDRVYYSSVNFDIHYYKNKDYVYMYEMINVESEEDKEEMISLLGLQPETFANIANATKLDSQHNHMYQVTDKDVNADITSSQLISNFKESNIEKNEFIIKSNDYINSVFSKMTDSNFGMILSKNIMKLGLFINSAFNINKELSNVIIDQRNDVLIENIKEHSENNIYVQYGQMHYKDFSEKMINLGYKVEKINNRTVFK